MNNKQISEFDLPESFQKLCENYSIVTLGQANELINSLIKLSVNIPSEITIGTLLRAQQVINENLDKETQEQLKQPPIKYNLDGYKLDKPVRKIDKEPLAGLLKLDDIIDKNKKDKTNPEEKNDDVY